MSPVREITCNVCDLSLGGFTAALKHMRFFTGYGFSPPIYMFNNCISLIAVRHLDLSNTYSCNMLFNNCISLIAIPELDTENVSDFEGMFQDCISIEYIPSFDTSSAWALTRIFKGCSALKELPILDTTNVSDYIEFIKGCISIKTIETLDTSRGTDFDEMFSGCISLRSIPTLDTSRANSMVDMFKSCHALASVPPLHTERITTLDLFEDSGITALVNLAVSEITTTLSFENMKALTRVSLSCNGWEGCNITFSGTCLSRDAYVEFFQSLPTISNEYTITLGSIIGGATALTAEDRAIATNKGWILE